MNRNSITAQPATPLPADDLRRNLVVARSEQDKNLPHVGFMGSVYTILVSGEDTDGRYCLIDMHVPQEGGPPHHRHDFEESFTVLEGEIEFTFRGEKVVAQKGETVNIPANAPHFFKNVSQTAARLLCIATPAGLDEFFLALGFAVPSRTSIPPELDETSEKEMKAKAATLFAKYRTELIRA